MPQKPIYSRPPVLSVQYCFPAAGTIRTQDERISRLYQKAGVMLQHASLLEGLFRIACLIKNKPLEEPVAEQIRNAITDTETGSFSGTFYEQICTARAAMALFEYNTDRTILKRLSAWILYIEADFDCLSSQDSVLYCPADLMELLVRFYLATGSKAALRMCAKLRAEAFDWATALHTFQQSIPIDPDRTGKKYIIPGDKPAQIDYEDKERLVNHGVLLADGFRYTLFAGLFSGHGQELSAGKTAWQYLLKHHHAVCGGTTGDPFLGGNASDQPVNNLVLSAWTEAFSAQMVLPDFTWAADEMIRIVYNGLDDCLNRIEIHSSQGINTICEHCDPEKEKTKLYARLMRAVAAAYRSAIALTEEGLRINYPIPARYLIMVRKQTAMLQTDRESITFICNKPVSVRTEIYMSPFIGCTVKTVKTGGTEHDFISERHSESGYSLVADTVWKDQDRIILVPDDLVHCEKTHHQGVVFYKSGQILCMPAEENTFSRAVCASPVSTDGIVTVHTAYTEKWKIINSQPSDIPVLPATLGEPVPTLLKMYSECPLRITIFPKARSYV